jgi:hypothetical protein
VLFGFGSIAQKISIPPSTIDNKNHNVTFSSASPFTNSKIMYKIIPAANKTWCYNILADGKMMIHQPSALGLPGNEGFKTKAAPQKVADLVRQKIKNGEMPPSISLIEMKKLKAID